jgi:quercetin dioxygenase-like cupin family protein
MRPSTLLLGFLLLLVAMPAGAQTPVPPATSGSLVEVTLEELPSGSISTVGIVRTTYEPRGGLRAATGSGPAVRFVERGAVTVRTEGDAQVAVVPAAGGGAAATPSASAGTEVTVEAGSAFLIPAGITAEIRNPGESPATTLDLLVAADATTDADTGVTHAVLAQQKAELPEPPVTMTLVRVTLEPGDQLELPGEAAQVVYVTVGRGQAFLLSGQGINRGAEPMEVYLLAFSGDTATVASPATSLRHGVSTG